VTYQQLNGSCSSAHLPTHEKVSCDGLYMPWLKGWSAVGGHGCPTRLANVTCRIVSPDAVPPTAYAFIKNVLVAEERPQMNLAFGDLDRFTHFTYRLLCDLLGAMLCGYRRRRLSGGSALDDNE